MSELELHESKSKGCLIQLFFSYASLRVNPFTIPTPWFVYIAQGRTGRYYTGITNEAEERIVKHNTGKGSRFARQQGPLTLVYRSEPYGTKSEARKREIQIKGWTREKKEKLINGEWE